jgi:hypothetical protein
MKWITVLVILALAALPFVFGNCTPQSPVTPLPDDVVALMKVMVFPPRTPQEKDFFAGIVQTINERVKHGMDVFLEYVNDHTFTTEFVNHAQWAQFQPKTGSINKGLRQQLLEVFLFIDANTPTPGLNSLAPLNYDGQAFVRYLNKTDELTAIQKILSANLTTSATIAEYVEYIDNANKIRTINWQMQTLNAACVGITGTKTLLNQIPFPGPLGSFRNPLLTSIEKLEVITPAQIPIYNPYTPQYNEFGFLSNSAAATDSDKAFVKNAQVSVREGSLIARDMFAFIKSNITVDTGNTNSRRLLALVNQQYEDIARQFCAQASLTTAQQTICTRGLQDLDALQSAITLFSTAIAGDANAFTPAQWGTYLSAVNGTNLLIPQFANSDSFGGVVQLMAGSSNKVFSTAAEALTLVIETAAHASLPASVIATSKINSVGPVVGLVVVGFILGLTFLLSYL